jgi:hypothetical protein
MNTGGNAARTPSIPNACRSIPLTELKQGDCTVPQLCPAFQECTQDDRIQGLLAGRLPNDCRQMAVTGLSHSEPCLDKNFRWQQADFPRRRSRWSMPPDQPRVSGQRPSAVHARGGAAARKPHLHGVAGQKPVRRHQGCDGVGPDVSAGALAAGDHGHRAPAGSDRQPDAERSRPGDHPGADVCLGWAPVEAAQKVHYRSERRHLRSRPLSPDALSDFGPES